MKKRKIIKTIKTPILITILGLCLALSVTFFTYLLKEEQVVQPEISGKGNYFKENHAVDPNLCLPLKGGSYSLEKGKFKDYYYGYELDLSFFPETKVSAPDCRDQGYGFKLNHFAQDDNLAGDSIPAFSAGASIVAPVKIGEAKDLLEYITLKRKESAEFFGEKFDPESALKGISQGKTKSGYDYITWTHTNSGGLLNYDYLIKIDQTIVSMGIFPGYKSSPVIINNFKKVVESFKLNLDLIGRRKTILEE